MEKLREKRTEYETSASSAGSAVNMADIDNQVIAEVFGPERYGRVRATCILGDSINEAHERVWEAYNLDGDSYSRMEKVESLLALTCASRYSWGDNPTSIWTVRSI
ncbi:hypothetical protein V6N12_010391 [Hibiscus sabdariffa]|uniref:Uncharacterized protein n=1 Tax=Hibiscus sabdariffa TaxID=183260 RepID=A0ABR2EMA2_9ROSI